MTPSADDLGCLVLVAFLVGIVVALVGWGLSVWLGSMPTLMFIAGYLFAVALMHIHRRMMS